MSRLPSHLSPRAPRRYAGYLTGLLLAAVSAPVVIGLGYVGPVLTHAAAAAVVAL